MPKSLETHEIVAAKLKGYQTTLDARKGLTCSSEDLDYCEVLIVTQSQFEMVKASEYFYRHPNNDTSYVLSDNKKHLIKLEIHEDP